MSKKYIYILCLILLGFQASAQLVFQNLEHDYGKVDKAKSLLSEFVVTNVGVEDAVILRIDAGGNFAFKLDQIIIKPGKSDTLRLFLKPTKAGRFNEVISVFLSSQDKPVILTVKGEIKEVDKDPMGTCYSFRENHPDVYKALAITDQTILVIDSITGQPIEGAFIQLFNTGDRSFYEYTKPDGKVKMTIQPNLYDINVRADFYKGAQTTVYISKDANIVFKLYKLEEVIVPPNPPIQTNNKKDTTTAIALITPPKLESKDTAKENQVAKQENITPIAKLEPKPDLVNGELNVEVYAPSNVVFLIDLSSSMNEPKKLPLLKKSMKTLVGTLRSVDKLTIVIYAENAKILLPPTEVKNKEEIYKLIDGLKASGLTAANRGLKMAYELNNLSYILGGNNQVILATDGMFNLSKLDEELLVKYSGTPNKIILSVVAFGNSANAKLKLSGMAEKGQGDYIDIKNESDSETALLDEIKNKSRKK